MYSKCITTKTNINLVESPHERVQMILAVSPLKNFFHVKMSSMVNRRHFLFLRNNFSKITMIAINQDFTQRYITLPLAFQGIFIQTKKATCNKQIAHMLTQPVLVVRNLILLTLLQMHPQKQPLFLTRHDDCDKYKVV